jgi:excisionase family DNA binding protein
MSAVKQPAAEPQFLTVNEVADLLRVKPRTVHYWVSERRIPFRKAGRFTIFDRDEILEWTRAEGDGGEKNSNVRPFSR